MSPQWDPQAHPSLCSASHWSFSVSLVVSALGSTFQPLKPVRPVQPEADCSLRPCQIGNVQSPARPWTWRHSSRGYCSPSTQGLLTGESKLLFDLFLWHSIFPPTNAPVYSCYRSYILPLQKCTKWVQLLFLNTINNKYRTVNGENWLGFRSFITLTIWGVATKRDYKIDGITKRVNRDVPLHWDLVQQIERVATP